jgi:hypothetical protein
MTKTGDTRGPGYRGWGVGGWLWIRPRWRDRRHGGHYGGGGFHGSGGAEFHGELRGSHGGGGLSAGGGLHGG